MPTKVSVIVPVYNTEKYLSKCLDSLTAQTLKNIEVICINDCSTDGSLDILKVYAAKDNRIKIIDSKENKGAAIARNKGINVATGEYIGFVDSDDFVDLDFYEKLYNKAKENNADAAKGNYKSATNGVIDYSLNDEIKNFSTNFAYAYCSAIFNRELLLKNNIKFPLLSDMEDPVFTFKFALLANKVEIVDTNINIVRRSDSLTTTDLTSERLNDKLEGLKLIIDLANDSDISTESYCYVTAFWFNQTFFNSIKSGNNEIKKDLANKLLKLFGQVKHKEAFIKRLQKYDEAFAYYLGQHDVERLIDFDKAKVFYKLRSKMNV